MLVLILVLGASGLPAGVAAHEPLPRLRIADIGVHAEVVELGLRPDGSLETPDDDYGQAGWWSGGPAPGEPGPVVIVGHVDSYRGPAVFWRLADLAPGALVEVIGLDGTAVRYRVRHQEQVSKDAFPTERVYGPVDGHELRLVTCGGTFDRDARSYTDNLIVYADQVHPNPPA
jgi:sortase (surface protein transpeptidase)